MGQAYQKMSDTQKAFFHLNIAIPIFLAQLGPAHPYVAEAKYIMA